MKGTLLLVLSAFAGVHTAQASDPGEFQLSVQLGVEHIDIDNDQLIGDHGLHHDGAEIGFAMGWRLPSGLLFEASALHADHTDFVGIIFDGLGLEDDGVDSHQYAAAVGWQFDQDRWRLTPKVGLARSRLTSSDDVLLTPDGARTDKLYETAPFIEAGAIRRLGKHFALGVSWRKTFQDIGSTQSLGATMHLFFD